MAMAQHNRQPISQCDPHVNIYIHRHTHQLMAVLHTSHTHQSHRSIHNHPPMGTSDSPHMHGLTVNVTLAPGCSAFTAATDLSMPVPRPAHVTLAKRTSLKPCSR